MGVLALVLLFNQTLGLLHGIAHGPSVAAGTATHVAPLPNAAIASRPVWRSAELGDFNIGTNAGTQTSGRL